MSIQDLLVKLKNGVYVVLATLSIKFSNSVYSCTIKGYNVSSVLSSILIVL